MAVSREEVVAVVRGWIETHWHHQAAVKGIGCDCIGLIAGVDTELGLPEGAAWLSDARYKGYGRTPRPELLLEACNEYMDPIRIDEAGLGDVLQMNYVDRGVSSPMHFGIITSLEPRMMAHALAAYPRKVVEHRIDEVWQSRILRAYRLRGVA